MDLVPDPDPILMRSAVCVASADSQILDQAAEWISLAHEAIAAIAPDAWMLDLSGVDSSLENVIPAIAK